MRVVQKLRPRIREDRAGGDEAQRDTYRKKLAEWLAAQTPNTEAVRVYVHAFGIEGHGTQVSEAGGRKHIDALSPEGDITAIMDEGKRYVPLRHSQQVHGGFRGDSFTSHVQWNFSVFAVKRR